MIRNEPAPDGSTADGSALEEQGSTYESAADVLPASVDRFGAGWKPEEEPVRLDDLLGTLSTEVKYEDFLRDPLVE